MMAELPKSKVADSRCLLLLLLCEGAQHIPVNLDSFLSLRMSPVILDMQLRAPISQRFASAPS